jgi:hypothetical protein
MRPYRSSKRSWRKRMMETKARRLRYAKYDEERYSQFVNEQARQLRERGLDEETAMSQAREIAEMYRHHFRVWK